MEQTAGKNTSSNYQKFRNLYRKWLVPKIVNKCYSIVTISEVEKANIIKTLGLSTDTVTVVHNGVSGLFGTKPSEEILQEVRKDCALFQNEQIVLASNLS